ncbi:hypothetical protein [Sphingomonas solaris]|uniref:Uncharacterized protein n=1 Tax=Alterirhizorhabdus solaris TaxID=2529389 RepID=A0A558R274_9SPHN|nr:hypothetical protein [Sphingomonas solaris]TVV73484.1 hypothetical protein FOY91_12155 [Sphingomonas solaris]
MSEDQALAMAGTLGAMTLVVASLMARRLPFRLVSRLALLWIMIFVGGILIVGSFPEIVAYFT